MVYTGNLKELVYLLGVICAFVVGRGDPPGQKVDLPMFYGAQVSVLRGAPLLAPLSSSSLAFSFCPACLYIILFPSTRSEHSSYVFWYKFTKFLKNLNWNFINIAFNS